MFARMRDQGAGNATATRGGCGPDVSERRIVTIVSAVVEDGKADQIAAIRPFPLVAARAIGDQVIAQPKPCLAGSEVPTASAFVCNRGTLQCTVIPFALEGIGSAVEGVSILLDNLNKGA